MICPAKDVRDRSLVGIRPGCNLVQVVTSETLYSAFRSYSVVTVEELLSSVLLL